MISKPVLLTPPATLPLSLESVKEFLRVDGTTEDSLITNQIKAVTRRLEALADRKFVTQTWEIYFDYFPSSVVDDWWDGVREGALSMITKSKPFIDLPFGPLQSITSFETFNEAAPTTPVVFPATNYTADTKGPFGRIALNTGAIWPTDVLIPVNGIKITGVFGFGAGYIPAVDPTPAVESTIPEDIQEAIKQMVAVTYEHRGDELPKIPANVAMLIEPYRRFKVGC